MKRILIFSVAYHPFIGGAEVAVQEITKRLSDFEFHLLTVNLDGKQLREEMVDNVHVHRLGSGKFSKFFFPIIGFLKARELEKKIKFDTAWSIMANQASVAAAFFKIAHPTIKLVLTVQEGDEETHLARYAFGSSILYKIFIRPWYRLVFKKADSITAISEYLKARAHAINTHVPIHIVPNGVDIEKFSQEFEDAELEKTRQEIGKMKGERIIITTSRLVEKNGVADLIAAMNYLPHSFRLCIIGSGELEENLRTLTASLKLSDRIQFLGSRPNSEILKYLKAADVFVRPSLSEGQGVSFMEAMAAGIPIIATPVGGIPDFLKDKETGLFVRPHNPKDIAEKITELFDTPGLYEHLIQEARKEIIGKYEWKNVALDMGKILDHSID